MGDADVALHELNDMQLDDMTEALDNFRDDLTNLHALVTEMERRVAHHILQRMRGYVMFRNFLIAINLVFIPVLMALGLSYILKEAIELEPQGPLQGFIEFLWFIAAFVGAPLYFGSIWAIYKFTQPEDSFEEISESEMDEEINDYEISMLMRQMFNRDEVNNNERIEHQLGENSGNEADDEDGEFVVSLNNQEPVQNDPDLPAVIQSVTESSIENTASVTEEQDNNIENQNGYPLALVHRHFLFGKSRVVQHLFFVVCGLTLGYYNYGFDIIHSIVSVFVMYVILATMGGTVHSVVISFFFLMGYLIYGYYFTATDDYDIKWSMPQCVLTLRLIGLAYDVYDGQIDPEKLSTDQKKTALKHPPTLLEVAGHTYFFGGFMVGPQFPMKRYLDFIDGVFPAKTPSGKPDCINAAVKRLGFGLLILSIYQGGSMIVPERTLLSDEFMQTYGFWKKLFLIGIWGKIVLYKYIACWLISEGTCILTGLTYNGKDKNGNDLWDGCANVKLLDYTKTTTFEGIIRSFNINTNLWVGQYVFKRLKFMGNRYISQAAALAFLAVWHGLHSGYYITFFNEFIVMYLEKDVENILNNRLPKIKEFFTGSALRIPTLIFLKVYVDIFMGYCIVPFVLLSWDRYMQVYGSVYYIGHVIYLSWPLLAPIIKLFIPKAKDDKNKKQ